ncbi:MAG: YqgE/AlgH family protein [Hyphomicrobiales bacterium]
MNVSDDPGNFQSHFLTGMFLVAMPGMMDQRFDRAVIYLCAHSDDGAMGIIINKPAEDIVFPELLQQLDIIPLNSSISLPDQAGNMKVLRGGPVETSRGFVLHSQPSQIVMGSVATVDEIRLSATIDILKSIARGEGPSEAIFALGYAGWASGQLESEIQANGWMICPMDRKILFDQEFDSKYVRALGSLGIDPAMLSPHAGRA